MSGPRRLQSYTPPTVMGLARGQRGSRRSDAVERSPSCRCRGCSLEDSSTDTSQMSGPRRLQSYIPPMVMGLARGQRGSRRSGAVERSPSCRCRGCSLEEGAKTAPQKYLPRRLQPWEGVLRVSSACGCPEKSWCCALRNCEPP